MIINLLCCFIIIGVIPGSSGLEVATAEQYLEWQSGASCAALHLSSPLPSIALQVAEPPGSTSSAEPPGSLVAMFSDNPFMRFILGKTKSPHILMGLNSSSSTATEEEIGLATQDAIVESEQCLKILEGRDEARSKRPLVQLDLAESTKFLNKWGLAKKQKKIAAVPDQDEIRRKLVQEYKALVLRVPGASNVGRQLEACRTSEERTMIVEHCLGAKATSTLMTRIIPQRAYLEFADHRMIELELDERELFFRDQVWNDPWPPCEDKSYQYALQTRSATAVRMFMEAINFMVGCFGFVMNDIRGSQRLHGFAAIKYGTLGFLRKAAVLLDAMIPRLEMGVTAEDLPPVVRNTCGGMLTMLMTRSRMSDWHHMREFMTTETRVKARVAKVKTSGIQDREELVLAGPLASRTGRKWMETFEEFRVEQATSLSEGWPLFPARTADGIWLKENASNQAVTSLMKQVVVMFGEDPTRITGHSPRRTAATMAARGGLSRDQQSQLLYHKLPGQKSTRAYDESYLEGVIPDFDRVLNKLYESIPWSADIEEQVTLDMFNTPDNTMVSDADSKESVSSQEEVCDPEDGYSSDETPSATVLEKEKGEAVTSFGDCVPPSGLETTHAAGEADDDLWQFDDEGEQVLNDAAETQIQNAVLVSKNDDGEGDDDESVEGDDDESEPQTFASRWGAIHHIMSGRVHLCADSVFAFSERTRCGIATSDKFELKGELAEYDILCAKCFRRPTLSLPGRQAVTM